MLHRVERGGFVTLETSHTGVLRFDVCTCLIACLRGPVCNRKQQSVISCRRCHLSNGVEYSILLRSSCFCRCTSKPPMRAC